MRSFFNTGLLSLALIIPVAAPVALRADDEHHERREEVRRYHDRERNDDHEWNERENRAYRRWAEENHRRYQEFNRLPERDQSNYWGWRHNHSDAQLNINIR